MKKILLCTALALGLAAHAHAQAYGSGVDGQSVFRVSQTQVVTYTSTAAKSAKLASDTRVIRLSCTTDCHHVIGVSGTTATASSSILFAGATEYFKVRERSANYVSVIQDASGGKAYIDEMVP
jgi:hypothetical protein